MCARNGGTVEGHFSETDAQSSYKQIKEMRFQIMIKTMTTFSKRVTRLMFGMEEDAGE